MPDKPVDTIESAHIPHTIRGRARRPPLRRNWRPRFLDAFRATCCVYFAAAAVGIDRSTVYKTRAADALFAQAFEDAREEAADRIEGEAWRRGVDGIEKPIYYKGKVIGTQREYSDALLILLVKGFKPEKYRTRQDITTGGKPLGTSTELSVLIVALTDDELEARIEAIKAMKARDSRLE